jgi:predicted DNA-binding transcriptional regulator YafY
MPRPNKLQRWVDLLSALLGRRRPQTFEELAERIPAYRPALTDPSTRDSIKRTFERDKKELKRFGVPIESAGGGDEDSTYRLDVKDFYLPYISVVTDGKRTQPAKVDRDDYRWLSTLAFEADELRAIAGAAARARQLGSEPLADDVDSALRKLAVDLPLGAAASADDTRIVAARAPADAESLRALGDALHTRKVVQFDYHALGPDATERRTVEPYGLFFVSTHWYLVGRDLDRDDLRNYRINRISAVKQRSPAKERPEYEIPTTFDLRKHARSKRAWELGDSDSVKAIVEFHGDSGATRAAATLGAPVAGNERRRSFAVRRSDAFVRWLLSLAGEATPVSPPELCAAYAQEVDAVRRVYAKGTA